MSAAQDTTLLLLLLLVTSPSSHDAPSLRLFPPVVYDIALADVGGSRIGCAVVVVVVGGARLAITVAIGSVGVRVLCFLLT